MNNFNKTFKTELIKKKRSGLFSLSIILGILIPVAYFAYSFFLNEQPEQGIVVNYYHKTLLSTLPPFLNFFLPLLIIISASKIAQIDHKNKGWQLMETQPISKFSIFFSKYVLLLINNVIAIFSYLLASFLLSWLFAKLKDLPVYYMVDFPFLQFVKLAFHIFIITLCITAFQYVLSVLIKGFIWPILIGFLTLLIPVFFIMYRHLLFWYPYIMLSKLSKNPDGSDFGYWFTFANILSLFFTVILLYIGFNWYRFKTFFNAFLAKKGNLIKSFFFLIVAGILISLTIKPKLIQKKENTILSGKINSDKNIDKVYLFDRLTRDTIVTISVVDNKFHHQFNKKIALNYYRIQFGNFHDFDLFFGEKDSIYTIYSLYGSENKFKIKGTRLAENIKINPFGYYNSLSYYLDQNRKIDDASYYMESIYENWQKQLLQLKNNRTIDNVVPRNDFVNRDKDRISLKYINYWLQFKGIRETLYPDKKYVVTDNIKKLLNSISLTNESLLTDGNYFSYVNNELIKDDKREVSDDQKKFDAIVKLDKGTFRDKLLYQHLNTVINTEGKPSLRDSLAKKYLSKIKTASYKNLIIKHKYDLNRLSKGIKAPNFMMEDSDKNQFQLTDFKGSYIVIDLWASWCGPCIRQAPFFEKKALKYKGKPIKFIAVSSDENRDNWLISIKNKSKTIAQYWLKNKKLFAKDYNISTIPKFILIDDKGNLIDVDFVRPSSKNFDELLNMHLKEK